VPDVVFQNAALLDLDAGELRPGSALRVENDRIVEVCDREIKSDGVREVDCRGRVLMPGLIDAHVHAVLTRMDLGALAHLPVSLIAQEARGVLEDMLLRGFTSVRDAGGADWGLAEAVDRGLIRGPRLFFSGRTLSQTGGHGDMRSREEGPVLCAADILSGVFSHVADGVDAVRKAAREELRRGAHQIKIMASGGVSSPSDPVHNVQYSAEEMRAIVEEAEGWHTYAMAHAYTPKAVTRAVEAGVRSIEHGNLIDRATAELIASRGAFLVPTLVTFSAIDELGPTLGLPPVSQQKVKDVLGAGLASLELARDAGVQMGFGTDLIGDTHHWQSREFRIRAEVLSPLEILRSATRVNARLLNRGDELGVIAPGAFADLLVVDGNPLENISLLEEPDKHLVAIMKGGAFAVDRLDNT
jgi:imidazolonepropionase-like amidohydrolase